LKMLGWKISHRILALLLISVVLLNATRYIFKFGSPGASPGYQETPLLFWAIKYALILGIFTVVALGFNKVRPWHYVTYVAVAIFVALGVHNSDSPQVDIAALYIGLSGLLFVLTRSNGRLASVEQVRYMIKVLWVLAGAALAFLILQIGLYLSMGVLPSHSHANSILIRFGSFLDDSLAFGILLPMFVGLCFYAIRDDAGKMIALLGICMIAVLTGSLTAMAVTALYTVWLLRQNLWRATAWLGLLSLLVLAFRWQFHELWLAKSGSIAGHVEGFNNAANNTLGPNPGFSESGLLLLFNNFAPPVLAGILLFHVLTFLACRRLLGDLNAPYLRPFAGAVEGLNFSAFVASLNLPVIMIFPVYLLLALFSAIVIGLAETSKKQVLP
jgi:hypothetical protein